MIIIFNDVEEEKSKKIEEYKFQPIKREIAYTYNDLEDINVILDYANKNEIPITTISNASNFRQELSKFNKEKELVLIDLTSILYAIEDNKSLIYTIEMILNLYENKKVIVLTSRYDVLVKYFPLYFAEQKSIRELFPKIEGLSEPKDDKIKVKKITNLTNEEYATFTSFFDHNLVGHNYFKEQLYSLLKSYITLNKLNAKNIFSIFLFGKSGIGKTEVARLLAEGLNENNYFVKINFQNYSSQDALNSLIGSPLGYVGCEKGELSSKLKKSTVGILLCDEFEKTTKQVFSFFLELLEEGKFSDSMTREYDLDGYIVVFTSNILTEEEYLDKIPGELQTRFDLVCEFDPPTLAEKKQFLSLLLEKAKKSLAEKYEDVELLEIDEDKLLNIEVRNIESLREIKRVFYNNLANQIETKL